MPDISGRQVFGPSCPSGGSWYACNSGTLFVGCCVAVNDPCQLGCPDGGLEPASFDPTYYGEFPDQECPIGSEWYTCAYTSPPFMGCCKTGPCKAGCPTGDLTAGFLSSNPAIAAAFENVNGTSSASTSTSSSLPTTSTVISSTVGSLLPNPSMSSSISSPLPNPSMSSSISSPLPNPSMSSSPGSMSSVMAQPAISPAPAVNSVPTGAVAGGCVGGVAVVALVFASVFVWWRRRTANRRKRMSTATGSSSMLGLKTSVTKVPPGMDTFLETKDSPYTGMLMNRVFIPYVIAMLTKSCIRHFPDQSHPKLPTICGTPNGQEAEIGVISRPENQAITLATLSSSKRLKDGLNLSNLPTSPQPPTSADPFTHPLYRLNLEEDGTAFRAELDATENLPAGGSYIRNVDRQQRRQNPQQKEYWGPGGRL
ncbi:hypothetical protein MMC11_004310 [Xylographa trunciseda]|nr:hypothetical protein [Xylographa trunciseda]